MAARPRASGRELCGEVQARHLEKRASIMTTAHNGVRHINPKMWSSTSWDGTGLCVYAKRLERGRFARLWREDGEDPITLTISELDLFLEGSTIVGRVALAP